MSKRLPLADFRAVRHKLESHEFAISEGEDVAPTRLIDKKTWTGITHLPDDVAIRTSDHNGHRLELLYSLWGDWIMATGDPAGNHPGQQRAVREQRGLRPGRR